VQTSTRTIAASDAMPVAPRERVKGGKGTLATRTLAFSSSLSSVGACTQPRLFSTSYLTPPHSVALPAAHLHSTFAMVRCVLPPQRACRAHSNPCSVGGRSMRATNRASSRQKHASTPSPTTQRPNCANSASAPVAPRIHRPLSMKSTRRRSKFAPSTTRYIPTSPPSQTSSPNTPRASYC